MGKDTRKFKNSEIPFVFVQLPMFNEQQPDTWTVVRDAQLYTVKNVHNTSMIVTVDCGEKDDVHPKNKKPVGERLALVVRQDAYKNGKYYPAKASVVKDKVIVWNEAVEQPTAVRYGWKNYIELNLVNKAGLPVAPFNSESKY